MEDPPKRTVPPHVIARELALSRAFEALDNCNGRPPAPGDYGRDYNRAVLAECSRELFGMLDSANVGRAETWRALIEDEEEGRTVACKEEERRELDGSLVLVVSNGGEDVRVGLIWHSAKSEALRVNLPGESRSGVLLDAVLGGRHVVVERIGRSARFARSRQSVVVVGYVGDLLASMTAACKPDALHDEEADVRAEDRVGFDATLIATLSTGVRRHAQWPIVHRESVAHLNETQFRALDSLTHNVELIRGPPGTGKSTLIDAFVRECVDDSGAVCVTAVQNRAVEALAKKFASAKTSFVACGTRASPATTEWTMAAQVDRDPAVVAARQTVDSLDRLMQRVRRAITLRMAKIYRLFTDTERSNRQRVRERWERRLLTNPSDELRASVAYKQFEQDFPTKQAKETRSAERKLEEVVSGFMATNLNPWRKAAAAVVRARMPEAHAFRATLDTEMAQASYALDKARETATLRIATEARALLCTTATVGTAMRTQRDDLGPLLARLSTLVCDEAGTLADRHIVPVLAAANVRRLVMVGDPAQLSCFSHVRGATPVSAMQRLLDAGMPSMLLTEQYRMPRALCDLVSQTFYDGQVVTSDGRVGVDVAAPVRFVPAPGGRAEAPTFAGGRQNTSVVNHEEVRIVAREVARLRGRYGNAAEVAVITTYAAQRNAIQDVLGGAADDIAVLTADSSQGQEFDFVVYSHVATDRNRLGFTTNRNRLCVAFSRAKRALVVVAHPDVLPRIPELRAIKAAAYEDSDEMRRVVVAALRDGRGRVDAANAFRVCCVCHDPISRSVGYLECDPQTANATVHAMCPECADGHVSASLETEGFDGDLHCPCRPVSAGGCLAVPFAAADVAKVVGAHTFERWNRAVVAQHERLVAQQLEREMTERLDARMAALNIANGGDVGEITRAVEHVVERILTLRCPVCDAAFVDFNGCAALTCRCGEHFCAFCLEQTPDDGHAHVAQCPHNPLHARGEAGLFVTLEQFERAQHGRKMAKVEEYLVGHPRRAAVLEALRPHGVDV